MFSDTATSYDNDPSHPSYLQPPACTTHEHEHDTRSPTTCCASRCRPLSFTIQHRINSDPVPVSEVFCFLKLFHCTFCHFLNWLVQNRSYNLNPRANTPASSIGNFNSCVSSSTELNEITQNVFLELFYSFLIYLLNFSALFVAEISDFLAVEYQHRLVIGFTMAGIIVFATRDAIEAAFFPGKYSRRALLIRQSGVALSGHQGALPHVCTSSIQCVPLFMTYAAHPLAYAS